MPSKRPACLPISFRFIRRWLVWLKLLPNLRLRLSRASVMQNAPFSGAFRPFRNPRRERGESYRGCDLTETVKSARQLVAAQQRKADERSEEHTSELQSLRHLVC